MLEKSAAAVQTATSRSPVKAGRTESLSERINRLYEAISRRAYELFERDGRAHGHDVHHWLEAEKEFLSPVPINIEENESEIVLRAELRGFAAGDLEVSVEPRRVTISGKRASRNENREGRSTYTKERSDEIFRSLELPSEVNATKVFATLKDGVLEILLPKIEVKKSVSAGQQTP